MKLRSIVALSVLLPTTCLAALPHNPGQTYLYLRVYEHELEARVEITVSDIVKATGLSLPTGVESGLSPDSVQALVEAVEDAVRAYVESKMFIGVDTTSLPLRFNDLDILRVRRVGDFIRLRYTTGYLDTVPPVLTVEFAPLLDVQPDHDVFLLVEYNWNTSTFGNESNVSLVFTPDRSRQELDISKSSVWSGLVGMIRLGVKHILIGYDHILFLIALVLPAVLARRNGSWVAVDTFRGALWNIVKIVTFFTVAHSITLSLAALEIISLSSRLVESVIALSIAVAAFHNLYPVVAGREGLIAFLFGLFHGMGFASLLSPLGLGRDHLTLTLLGFNLGVELGQVAIIAVAFPILFVLRKQKWYVPLVLRGGSAALIVVSGIWFTERALDMPSGRVYRTIRRRIVLLFGG